MVMSICVCSSSNGYVHLWVQLKQIHLARYLLRYSALELFFTSSHSPLFLNLSSPAKAIEAAKELAKRANLALSIHKNITSSAPQDTGAAVPSVAPIPGQVGAAGGGAGQPGVGATEGRSYGGAMGSGSVIVVDKRKALELAEQAKAAWVKREMSTFEYLMALNTLAGRSYNDLMQYPVFPWVVADYTSEVLDLKDPKSFRDLSKPVGALDEKRFQVFEDRYLSFSDPDIPR